MKRKIIWSLRAQESFDNLILFLEANWEKKVVDDFFQEFLAKLNSVSENPEMFRMVSEKKKIRRCIIKR